MSAPRAPAVAQLALGVRLRATRSLDSFVVGQNDTVLRALRELVAGSRPGPIYLQGPAGSGKSHLLHGCCASFGDSGAAAYVPLAERGELTPQILAGLEQRTLVCVDDVDAVSGEAVWERALFSLFNDAEARGARLLFAARRAPASLVLPDLRSRLGSALRLALAAPDDAQRRRVLAAHAAQLGFALEDAALDYILARQPRDLGRLVALLEALDAFALASKRRVTLALVRDYLAAAAAGPAASEPPASGGGSAGPREREREAGDAAT